MEIDKVIQELSKGAKFRYKDIDVKEMLISSINKKTSVIGMVIIDLLEQAEEGEFK